MKLSIRKYKKRKKEVYYITRLLYYFLRHHPDNIYLEKVYGGRLGYYDQGTAEITIDYRYEIIPTLIHEFLHHLYPSWSETKVLKKEKEVMSIMTTRQSKNILRVLTNCLK